MSDVAYRTADVDGLAVFCRVAGPAEPGQSVVPHGIDRNLDLDEAPGGARP